MKIRPVVAVIAMSLCQMAFAKDPVPLAKAPFGDRTSHPVLFVSGLGSNPSGTWGAKGRQIYCAEAELLVDVAPRVESFVWYSEFKGLATVLSPSMRFLGKFIPTISYPYRCANMSGIHYGGEIVLNPLEILYERSPSKGVLEDAELRPYVLGEVTREKNENVTLPFGKFRRFADHEKFDFGRFWLIVGGNALSKARVPLDSSHGKVKDVVLGEMYDYLRPVMEDEDVYERFYGLEQMSMHLTKNAYVALQKKSGINLMADSLLDRSRAAMAVEINANVALHPVEDWDWQHDLPTKYEATGLPAAIAELFDLPAKNVDSTYAKITNGIYFFNAKSRCHASDQDGIGAECDALDEWANPRWDTSFENYGQPNQLLDKMVRTLDDFYGKGKWHDDPNAVIDIVAHSQGGLITRIAVEKSRGREGRNPINHINRIITINSPHRGAALASSPEWLKNGNLDDEGAAYPQLAELKEWLFSKDEFVSLHGSVNFVLTRWLENLQFVAALVPVTRWFGMTKIAGTFDFSGAPLGPYKFDLEIDAKLASLLPVELRHEDGTITLGDIGELAMKSEHLAWPAESDYMRELDAMPYPTYPKDGRNIHVTHFYSKGLRYDFLELFGAHLLQWGYNQCVDMIHDSGYGSYINAGGTCTKLFMYAKMGLYGNSLEKLEKRFKKLDTDWPYRSDLVVENSSQRGIPVLTPTPSCATALRNTIIWVFL